MLALNPNPNPNPLMSLGLCNVMARTAFAPHT